MLKKGLTTIALFALVFIGQSLSSAQDLQKEADQEMKPQKFTTLAKKALSIEREKKNVVIRTPEEWAKFWEALHADSAEKPELPEINFNKRLVIAVFAGEKPTPGFDIAVSSITRVGKRIRVAYQEVTPGAGCVTPQVIAQPFHIIVTKTAPDVAFDLYQETRDCR